MGNVVVETCPEGHVLAGELRCVARRKLECGSRPIRYAGQLYRGKKGRSDYSCGAGENHVVDAQHYCNEAAFINHFSGIADAPNCQFKSVEGELAAVIHTLRDIQEGEELLVDYGKSFCM